MVGTYPITYKVTDSHGLFATKTINVTVSENKPPVIHAENRTIDKGELFNPYDGVTATDEEDGDLTDQVEVSVNQVDTNIPGQYNVIYTVKDSQGLTAKKTIIVTVNDTAGKIDPNDYTVGGTLISGTYEGAVSSLKLYVDGNPISNDPVMDNGKFTFSVGKDLINIKSNVVVVAYNKNNEEVDRKTVTVIDNKQGTITPDEYTVGDQFITGTYTGYVKKAHIFINGTPGAWGGSFDNNGRFKFYVGRSDIKKDDRVTLDACAANDQVLQTQVSVKITQPEYQGTITPDEYTVGDQFITGTYTGDVKKAHIFINGTPGSWGGSFDNNGRFKFYVGRSDIKKDDRVTLDACAAND
ncbi:immunoglobulin-like domain-containing protein, partial [Enterococcus faecium]